MGAWANDNLIHKTVAGSRLYGTSGPDSDTDLRGVCLMPRAALLGFSRFEQHQTHHRETDIVIYGLTKFFMLTRNNNPNLLDILFSPPSAWLMDTATWRRVYSERDTFLSQRLRYTFSGYAVSQLKRIKGHRRWLTDPPERKPVAKDFRGRIETGEKGEQNLVFPSIHFEQQYKAVAKTWKDYQRWLKERNPKRAELERRYGYDVKHASHLVRLMVQAQNVLAKCTYNPVLSGDDLDLVLGVLGGEWEYDYLIEWAETNDARIKAMDTDLPKKPRHKRIERLLMSLNEISLLKE